MSKLKTRTQILKVFSLTLLLYALTFTLYASPVSAQTATSSSTSGESKPTPEVSKPQYPASNLPLPTSISPTSPLYTDLLVHNMFHSFSCLAIGQSVIGQPCLTYKLTQNAQGMIEGVPVLSSVNLSGGVLGTTTSLIGALYDNRPVRTADYLASVGQGLGIVKEANAQVVGSGQAVLSPILTLWQVSRNISYVIMIVIFVVIGLMVMFRNRINPQTVITAQAALPGLVIGLIMITFSYFFAGLISDMAFVGTNVVGYYFAAAQGPTALADLERTNLAQRISTESVFTIFGRFVGITSDHANEIFDTIMSLLPTDVATSTRILVGFVSAQLAAPVGGLAGPFAAVGQAVASALGFFEGVTNITGIRGGIIKLAVVAILLYAMFRLLLRLVNSYLTIIFLTLSAPFQFLFASLPGRQGIFTAWVMGMLGNILVFPAVLAVFYFVTVLLVPIEPRLKQDFPLKVSGVNQIQNNGLTPTVHADGPINVVDKFTFPLLGGMDLKFIRLLLAIGALIALPAIPDIVVRAVGKASEAGQLIGQELGGNVRAGQGYASQYARGWTQTGQTILTGVIGERELGPYGTYVSKLGLWHIFHPPTYPTPPTPTAGGGAPGPCLPQNTMIATPFGPRAIKDIHKGDSVWTITSRMNIKQVTVKATIRRKVSKQHKLLHLVLADQRELFVSPGHPDAFGKDLAFLKIGDYLDRSYIVKREILPYNHKYTYDILPEGETGNYFANNILIGSTINIQINKSLVYPKSDFSVSPGL